MNYKRMSFISGIVIFLSIVILLVTIITLSGKRIFFTRDYIIYVKFDDVIGLQDKAKVFMRGYRIGWTKDVHFEKDGVVVRVDVNKKYKIPLDSKIEINTISLLGEKAITIHPGHSQHFIAPGSIVRGKNKDIISQTKEILEMVKMSIKQGELNDKAEKISESIDLFHSLLSNANKKVGQLDIEQYNSDIHNIGLAGKKAQKAIDKSSDSLKLSMTKFNKTMEELSSLSVQLKKIARKINQGQGSAGALINDKAYIDNLNKTINELNTLISDFKKHPKKYIDLSIF